MKQLFLLLLLTPLFFISCNDDDMAIPKQLPPVTSEGLNTFGCLMNGEPWVSEDFSSTAKALDIVYWEGDNFISITANRKFNNDLQNFSFFLENFEAIGIYEIPYIDDFYLDFDGCGYYDLDITNLRKIEITKFDKEFKIISGTFEFTLLAENCIDTLKVSEGRFDGTYRE